MPVTFDLKPEESAVFVVPSTTQSCVHDCRPNPNPNPNPKNPNPKAKPLP